MGRFVSLTPGSGLFGLPEAAESCFAYFPGWFSPALLLARAHVTLRESGGGGRGVLSLPPDLKGNFSSQLKVWICMLGVGILNLFPFWKLHCDKSSYLFLLTRSQVGQPASADSAGCLWVYFCEQACLLPCYPGPFPRTLDQTWVEKGCRAMLTRSGPGFSLSRSREGFPWLTPDSASPALSCPG